jgi:hypothetical protein
MSSEKDRLAVIHDAYSQAYSRRLKDWREAKSQAQAKSISDNLNRLELAYLRAAKQALDANGKAVEDAYKAAKTAQVEVDDAYKNARDIAEKIRLVSSVVTSVGDLLKKAGAALAPSK